MTQIKVTVLAIKNSKTEETKLKVEFDNGKFFNRTLNFDTINTEEKFARWLLSQEIPDTSFSNSLTRVFVVDYHIETVEDESGNLFDIRELDNVTTEQLPASKAKELIESLPGLGGTQEEMEAWIDGNITNFSTAKEYLKALSASIIELKNLL